MTTELRIPPPGDLSGGAAATTLRLIRAELADPRRDWRIWAAAARCLAQLRADIYHAGPAPASPELAATFQALACLVPLVQAVADRWRAHCEAGPASYPHPEFSLPRLRETALGLLDWTISQADGWDGEEEPSK